MNEVAEVRLCLRSWYGHPDAHVAEAKYNATKQRLQDGTDVAPPENWMSGLRCWQLIDAEGLTLGRAYEPTPTTSHWVFTDEGGHNRIDPIITMEKLTVLMVEFRLLGGADA